VPYVFGYSFLNVMETDLSTTLLLNIVSLSGLTLLFYSLETLCLLLCISWQFYFPYYDQDGK
jgi:hypothetical protein